MAILKKAYLVAVCFWVVFSSGLSLSQMLLDNLTDAPFNLATHVPGNLIFALSVEYPTATSPAFASGVYRRATTYKGYFDPEKCYTYNDALNRFEPDSLATNHVCGAALFSGNVMNFALMTTIDIFRLATTGGYRLSDTEAETVLQRSYMSTNSVGFPDKEIKTDGNFPDWGQGANTNIKFISDKQGLKFKLEHPTNAALNKDFFARVLVCDEAIGLEGNCVQYQGGSGNAIYKPEGVIQANSKTLRFGVFGYYLANNGDNAVMVSPAKYVGPEYWRNGLFLQNNPVSEWDETTGIQIINSDLNLTSHVNYTRSGVTQYINYFGFGNQSYKALDPVGKLHYEAVKYLRGFSRATRDFYDTIPANGSPGATSTNMEGFPVVTSWRDPFRDDVTGGALTCRQSAVAVVGDIFTWCDSKLPGSKSTGAYLSCLPGDVGSLAEPASAASPPLDVSIELASIDRAELANGVNLRGSLPATIDLTEISTSGHTGSNQTNSFGMAGTAYWANREDVRSDISGKQTIRTIIIDVQENRYCGYNYQYWLAAKYGGATGYSVTGEPLNWSISKTFGSDDCTLGRPPSTDWPKSLLDASTPDRMIDAIQEVVDSISNTPIITAPAAQASTSVFSNTKFFQGFVTADDWSGDLKQFNINRNGDITEEWSAVIPTTRSIFTYNNGFTQRGSVDRSQVRSGIVAQDVSALSRHQRSFLDANQNADEVFSYVLGDRSNEEPNGLKFRERNTLLGDIVSSGPSYVGKPGLIIGALNSHDLFRQSHENRTPMVYVGANDGMLHAFDVSGGTSAGEEKFAYIPSAVYHNLIHLTDPNYTHRFFVDGPPVVMDVCRTTACANESDWRTMLVGNLRAGGRGIYALDITDPDNFSEQDVMWEFTSLDDQDLGYTFSQPEIVKMNNDRWAVVIGNGYRSDEAGRQTGSGDPAIFILWVDGPQGTNNHWNGACSINHVRNNCRTRGNGGNRKDYIKVSLGSVTGRGTLADGTSDVTAVDRNFDGKIDIIYATTLLGQIWKLDVSSPDISNWNLPGQNLSLFDTKVGANYEPITGGIEVADHPQGGFMLYFGTGSYHFLGDQNDTGERAGYGIWDKDGATFERIENADLQKQGVLSSSTSNGKEYVLTSSCKTYYSTPVPPNFYTNTTNSLQNDPLCPNSNGYSTLLTASRSGFRFVLPNAGERLLLRRPAVRFGIVTFSTLVSGSVLSDPCNSGTDGWRYDLDYLTGGRPSQSLYTTGAGSPTPIMVDFQVPNSGSNQMMSMAPSGVKIPGGVLGGPISFKIPEGGAGNAGSNPNTSALIARFIPGWGIGRVSTCDTRTDLNIGSDTTHIANCGGKGRISWRQFQ